MLLIKQRWTPSKHSILLKANKDGGINPNPFPEKRHHNKSNKIEKERDHPRQQRHPLQQRKSNSTTKNKKSAC